jgi:DNA-binding NtrC family response regulator
LNLEDSPKDTELIEAAFKREGLACEMIRVDKEKDFVAAIDQCRYDLLLVDYKLPAFDGLTALKIAMEKCPDIPFIFFSGSIGEDIAIEALKRGATDYVLKDNLSRLVPAVKRALKEAEEKREHKRAEMKINEQLKELHRWQDIMVDREDRVQELKREVNELCLRLGQPIRYRSQETGEGGESGTAGKIKP